MKTYSSLALLMALVVSLAYVNSTDALDFTDRECMMCRFSVGLVSYAMRTKRGSDQIYRLSNSFCSTAQIESPLVCSNITKLFNREVVKVLANGLITPDQVCGYLSNNKCGHFHQPFGNWEINLDMSVHLNQREIAKSRENELRLREPQKPYKVIHISDTHVDLQYQEMSPANCQEPLCCRANSTLGNGTARLAGYWGSYDHCDIPMRTFESALDAINETIKLNEDIAYIIWTGDIQPHDVWNQNKKNAKFSYQAVFSKILSILPQVRIFPTLGNHEMVPVDSFSPSNLIDIAREDSPQWLYRELDSYWSRWLPPETANTITKDGFYAVEARPGLKIISLNTNFCHNKNFWLFINSTDPGKQLEWLVHELQISELTHEQVHIIGHIPPGVEECLKVWSKNFNKILRRFSRTVSGLFFGHTHNNEFEIVYDQDGPQMSIAEPDNQQLKHWFDVVQRDRRQLQSLAPRPISVVNIGSSLTTFIGVNPSYRIYTIDANQGFMPTDFETIYMNLTAANEGASLSKPVWVSAGSFSRFFGLKDTSPQSMHNFLVELAREIPKDRVISSDSTQTIIAHDTPDQQRLFEFFRFYHVNSGTFMREEFDKLASPAKRRFLCKFFTAQALNPYFCDTFITTL